MIIHSDIFLFLVLTLYGKHVVVIVVIIVVVSLHGFLIDQLKNKIEHVVAGFQTFSLMHYYNICHFSVQDVF